MVHAGASPSWEQMWAAGLQPGQAFDQASPCMSTDLGETHRTCAGSEGGSSGSCRAPTPPLDGTTGALTTKLAPLPRSRFCLGRLGA